jgi:SAM-dependent methyltransferase
MTLARHERDWQDLAELDPLWAVLGANAIHRTAWDVEAFMAKGRREAERALADMRRLGLPLSNDAALDFGCGVGRLDGPLAEHFGTVVGVDISTAMLEQAERLNAGVANLRFVHNARPDLTVLDPQRFDLVYCRLVLQHMPSVAVAVGYIAEFVRVLTPGGLAFFEVTEHIPRRHRLQPQRRLYALLRALGVPPRLLFRRLRLQPERMISIPEPAVRAAVVGAGGVVVADERRRSRGGTVKHSYSVALPDAALSASSDGSLAAMRSASAQSSG